MGPWGVFPIMYDSMTSLFYEITFPFKYITIYSIGFQFVQKLIVWYHIRGLWEVQDGHVNLDLFISYYIRSGSLDINCVSPGYLILNHCWSMVIIYCASLSSAWPPTRLTDRPTYLPAYLPAYLPTYLPTYLYCASLSSLICVCILQVPWFAAYTSDWYLPVIFCQAFIPFLEN